MNVLLNSGFRIESKYVLSEIDLNKFRFNLYNHGFINIYPKRYVYSLYCCHAPIAVTSLSGAFQVFLPSFPDLH